MCVCLFFCYFLSLCMKIKRIFVCYIEYINVIEIVITGGIYMGGVKRFGTSLFGYKKSDVNAYIDKLISEVSNSIKDKETQILMLKNQLKDIKAKYDELIAEAEAKKQAKDRVADILLDAREQAEQIIKKAAAQHAREMELLKAEQEKEREKLVLMKEEVREYRIKISETLKKLDFQMNTLERELEHLVENDVSRMCEEEQL